MKTRALAISLTLLAAGVLLPAIAEAATKCPLKSSFAQPDVDPVWNDKLKMNEAVKSIRSVLFDKTVVVFSELMAVDADGSAYTYSAKDPMADLCNPQTHPENIGKDPVALGCAMDKLCYGVNMRVPDEHGGFKIIGSGSCRAVGTAFQKAMTENWEAADGTRIAKAAGIEMRDAKKHVPCIDKSNAFLVSKTIPSGFAGELCEQQRWLDPLVPFVVVPQCWTKNYRADNPKTCAYLKDADAPDLSSGDLVALRSRDARDKPIFALIGDAGPNGKLGEASIGLLMKSESKTERPTFVAATDWFDRRKKFDVVIFRGTKYIKPATLDTYGEIETTAHKKFTDWAGDDDKSLARLAACGLKASPN